MAILDWDPGEVDNTVTGGDGNWDLITANWTVDNGEDETTFSNGDSVRFLNSHGDVIVTTAITVGDITVFEDDGFQFSISGADLTFLDNSTINLIDGSTTTPISNNFVGSTSRLFLAGHEGLRLTGDVSISGVLDASSHFSSFGEISSEVQIQNSGRMFNHGTVSGTITLARDVQNHGDITGGIETGSNTLSLASVLNELTGTIASSTANAISGSSGFDFVENHGLITGDVRTRGQIDQLKMAEGAIFDGAIYMGGGNDSVMGNISGFTGGGTVKGIVDLGSGDDNLNAVSSVFEDKVFGGKGSDKITGGTVEIDMRGSSGTDTLLGSTMDDRISGGNGGDTIDGEAGEDLIFAGRGKDEIQGGFGQDTFAFKTKDEISQGLSNVDVISDYGLGGARDIIDVGRIDADEGVAGNQEFTFIGDGAFTSVVGQLRAYKGVTDTFVQGDIDGDGVGDFKLKLLGQHDLVETDFIL